MGAGRRSKVQEGGIKKEKKVMKCRNGEMKG